jgi:hypothetical protein
MDGLSMSKVPDRESGVYFTAPIGIDQGIELDLNDENTPWVAGLLSELEESLEDDFDPAVAKTPSYFKLKGVLEKKHNGTYDDFLLFTGEFQTLYNTHCVSSGASMKEELCVDVCALFLEKRLEKELELEEETEIFYDDREYDLYYFDKRQVDLKTMVHEYLYLNINPYPRA